MTNVIVRLFTGEADKWIGGRATPYLKRWFIRHDDMGRGNIYVHNILRDDDDRALHDHPWDFYSFLFWGGYKEHLVDGTVLVRRAPSLAFRRAEHAHRIELCGPADKRTPAWTLVITSRKVRVWGFLCKQGWRHWRIFVGLPSGEADGSEKGPGCE